MTQTRRGLAALVTVGLGLGLTAVPTTSAHADDKVDLNVVGTSDVSDSKLFDYLKPKFEAAYPEYNLLYSGNATSTAITLSKTGNYDALIVHAASVENQYVADGWSAEPYGRAIFWGDFVLLGPAGDPAGVKTGDEPSHDVAAAFEKIAAAGELGNAHFISRAAAPGTTVQEHAIWALTDDSDVAKCTVSSALGGGETPSTDPSGEPCPSPTSYPSWYNSGDRKQAANVQYADQCSVKFGDDPDCYVLTDRGTYKYLASQDPSPLSTLQIVARDNDAAARGGVPALVNSFHAYAINPDMFDDPDVKAGINLTGATDFLDWLTSSAGQAAAASYLNADNDPPFLPSATPNLTVSEAPAKVSAGGTVTITGKLANVVPGTPALNGVPVHLVGTPSVGTGTGQQTVATATTNASGNFKITYKPSRSLYYSVTVDQITKIENAALDPVFGDLLQPTSASAGRTVVLGKVTVGKVALNKRTRTVSVRGAVGPRAMAGATVKIFGKLGQNPPKLLQTIRLRANATAYTAKVKLKRKGTWKLRATYANGTSSQPATSPFTRALKVT